MVDRITLNDGTVLEGHILENGDGQMIFVYLDGMSLTDGFVIFNDPERTKRIYAGEKTYEGYTQLWAINNEFGNCNVTMRKG